MAFSLPIPKVVITIHDENDNAPQFPSTQYQKQIPEDYGVDKPVLTGIDLLMNVSRLGKKTLPEYAKQLLLLFNFTFFTLSLTFLSKRRKNKKQLVSGILCSTNFKNVSRT